MVVGEITELNRMSKSGSKNGFHRFMWQLWARLDHDTGEIELDDTDLARLYRVLVRTDFLPNRGFMRRWERGRRLKRGSSAPSGKCALEATAGSRSHPRKARLVARLDDVERQKLKC